MNEPVSVAIITSVEDILLLASFILLTAGIFGVFIRPIRQGLKVIHEEFRLRHLFIGFLLCFSLGLVMAWDDVVEGCNDTRYEFRKSEDGDAES